MKLYCVIDLRNGQELQYNVSGRSMNDATNKAVVCAKKFNKGNPDVTVSEGVIPFIPNIRVKITDKAIPEGTVNGRPKVFHNYL